MKKIITILCLFIVLCGCNQTQKPTEEKDIKDLYPEITGECIINQANKDDVLAMLKNGTGVVFFSWIDCPWCHGYIDLVNQAGLDNGVNVLYYDIYDDRNANNEFYQEVTKLIADKVDAFSYTTNNEEKKAYDANGKVRIYVPMTVMVIKGEVVALDYSSSMESNYEENFDKYWAEEIKAGYTKRDHLKEFFNEYFSKIKTSLDEQSEQGCSENCKIG